MCTFFNIFLHSLGSLRRFYSELQCRGRRLAFLAEFDFELLG